MFGVSSRIHVNIDSFRTPVVCDLHKSAIRALILLVESSHVVATKGEVVDIRVLLDSRRSVALWQRYPILLQAVPYQNLGRGLAMLFCNSSQVPIICLLVADQWTICLHSDAILVAVVNNFTLLTPRMKLREIRGALQQRMVTTHLKLVYMRRPHLGVGLHCFDHAYTRVAHTDGLYLAFVQQSLHGLPHELDSRTT